MASPTAEVDESRGFRCRPAYTAVVQPQGWGYRERPEDQKPNPRGILFPGLAVVLIL